MKSESDVSSTADRDPSGPSSPNSPERDEKASSSTAGSSCGDLSFSHMLAGALTSPAEVSSQTSPEILTAVPLDQLQVVAVPCFIAPAALMGQFAMTHQAVLATVTAQAQLHLQSIYASSSMESASGSFVNTASPSIAPSPSQGTPLPSSKNNQTPTSDQKEHSSLRLVLKEGSNDEYNWRKYGQKQVKCSDKLRSYYRCTTSNCSAKKKVEHFQDGRVIEVMYGGVHNHEPPQKYRCFGDKKTQSGGPVGEQDSVGSPSKEVLESNYAIIKLEKKSSGGETDEQHLDCSLGCEEDTGSNVKDDLHDELGPKRRRSENILPYSNPVFKTNKEPKVVVQRICDVSLASNDGYRWRKYGQKFVKGNPNPRSYYRCTNNGCLVRKHVEKASEDAKSVVITYEGKHNHEFPSTAGDRNKFLNCKSDPKLGTNGVFSEAVTDQMGEEKALNSVRTLPTIRTERPSMEEGD